MKRHFLIVLVTVACAVISCAQKKDFVVTIKTNYGDMVAILYDETPKHKANFIKLALAHYFDSLLFHRVIDGFMIQGGDPDSKKAKPGQRLGSGGPAYTIEAEFNPKYFHEKGSLSAARQGDQVNPSKASSGSQFYVVQGKKMTEDEIKLDQQKLGMAFNQFMMKPENAPYRDTLGQFYQRNDRAGYEQYITKLKPVVEKSVGYSLDKQVSPELVKAYTTIGGTPNLDGQYTVFGKVIKGLEVIDKIATLPRDQFDRPKEDVRMIVTVEEISKSKITKLYGYQYPEENKK